MRSETYLGVQEGLNAIRAMQQIKSNAIPCLIDFEIKDERIFLKTGAIFGLSLRAHLKKQHHWAFLTVLMNSGFLALEQIHGCGWLLREMTPDSIYVDGGQRVYFTDLTLAIEKSEVKHIKEAQGTLGFMAPEAVYTPNQYVAQSDCFALAKCFLTLIEEEGAFVPVHVLKWLHAMTAIQTSNRPSYPMVL